MVKRVIFCLLALLLLCLGLCACNSQLPPETLEQLYGEWIVSGAFEKDGVIPEETAFLLRFFEDGTAQLGEQEGLRWIARTVKETSGLEVTIREGKQAVYKFTVQTAGDGLRHGQLTDQKGEASLGEYLPSSAALPEEWAERILISWYPDGNNENTMAVTLKEDGFCVINGMTYRWAVNPHQEEKMGLLVFEDRGAVYSCECQWDEKIGIPRMSLYHGNSSEWIDYYQFHPLYSMMEGNWWIAFDTQNFFLDKLYTGRDSFIVDEGLIYTWELSRENPADKITAYIPNAQEPEYVVTVTKEGQYPNLALEVQKTGEIINCYGADFGYDPESSEAIYYDALHALQSYTYGFGYRNEAMEPEETLYGLDILPYVYAKLQEVKGYKESQSYLDRFTVSNRLTEISTITVDSLGNTTQETDTFGYDLTGRLKYFSGLEHSRIYGISELANHRGYPTYNEEGVITRISVKADENSWVMARATPSYDEAGRLISMHVRLDHGSEYTSVFTYNKQGQLTGMEMPYYKCPLRYTYSYDADGRLSRIVEEAIPAPYAYVTTYATVTDYVYEDGVLTQKTQTHIENWGKRSEKSYTETYTYTNDEAGRPLRAAVTSTEPNKAAVSEEVIYRYQDIYFYEQPHIAGGCIVLPTG